MAAILAAQGGGMTELAEIPPPPPLFFLSYARSGRGTAKNPVNELDMQVMTFFRDLSMNVDGLTVRRPGADPGFMDRSMNPGSEWSGELLEMVGICKVFVALLSPSYTASEWCGKEWNAFSRRKVTGGGRGAKYRTGIIPVIWAPYPEELFPSIIRNVQWFSPEGLPDIDIVAEYQKNGVSGLMYMRQDIFYRGIVLRLAQHIANFHHSYEVEPQVLREDELHNIFQEHGS